jgi:hypothetical protein
MKGFFETAASGRLRRLPGPDALEFVDFVLFVFFVVRDHRLGGTP